jgi:hypothetical protein
MKWINLVYEKIIWQMLSIKKLNVDILILKSVEFNFQMSKYLFNIKFLLLRFLMCGLVTNKIF